ncbi:hypothetical protein BCR41DRAFT_171525 [Lobosporangium transversale]|uniref:HMG box domain-containing protein n=1 Tax=Lobosporangium transversale TaxID=64571 RepID=A0A1Y2GFD8_9FUNG|nr:hypothetical protein BCR41DRAFT_171525 [Lobosporangium transversale]ORZ06132.1 hypothetical protein BCR41DRAFT_171525 [Lobosporangium transversale]|eukprot:XP_021877401.1 hypothetical protein BCR41DRAFT_171525 [Lobosporangium transversale]
MSDSAESSDSEVYIPRDPVVPLPVTGPRERKQVERFAVPVVEKPEKKLEIPHGKGVKLGDIPVVSANLDKLKVSDETVKGLHRLLFGRVTATKSPKNDIKAFYGFADLSEKEEEAYEEKLGKWTVGGLRELIELFNLETGGDKDALLERIMVFLKKPADSGLVPRAQKLALEAKEKRAQKQAAKKAKLAAKAKKAAELKAKKSEAKKALLAKKKDAQKTKTTVTTKAANENAKVVIPKIRSAFDMYVKEHQKEIKEKVEPDASRADIYKKLVDKWEAVPAATRKEYEAKAEAENAKNAEKRAKALEAIKSTKATKTATSKKENPRRRKRLKRMKKLKRPKRLQRKRRRRLLQRLIRPKRPTRLIKPRRLRLLRLRRRRRHQRRRRRKLTRLRRPKSQRRLRRLLKTPRLPRPPLVLMPRRRPKLLRRRRLKRQNRQQLLLMHPRRRRRR